ncbi:DUF1775 domain-containing protein [Actinoplanes couchii]|uniref:YncI copper-binding domain-containing protein n=1 Tax=Actinoplanes couchii TaxID=403638 RepID=A0ABQ3X1E8_9ACTN|nr:DUF1775 domain-containing protein [Actinoplanes couchii]MDR6316683.1 hypothetical protein [Actinoplanes couchii]GID52292.1 hypothetical protein Aco03nite_006960 [Actinoplanes couchii]
MARRAGVMTAATAVGVLLAAAPAAADVTVSPASAPQGSGASLDFHVTNEGTAPITEVTLKIPADTPIAEVYPLSIDDWAPKITYQRLQQPLETIHGGTPVTEAASAITWIAVNGTTIKPGESADLRAALGPLPTLSTMRMAVETKYADGSAGPAMAATMTLTPSDGTAPVSHHGGAATGSDVTAEDLAFAAILAEAEKGPSWMSISGWIVAVLALLGTAWFALRGRHRAEEEPGEPDDKPAGDDPVADDDADKEPVGAGSSKWAFKG